MNERMLRGVDELNRDIKFPQDFISNKRMKLSLFFSLNQ
jgi:hypothetical protein